MAVAHGKKAVVQLDNGAGTLTDITAFVSKTAIERVRDTAETSVFGLENKTYVAGLKNMTVSLEGNFDAALDAILDAALGTDNTKTVQIDPQGAGTGNIRYSVETLVTKYSIDLSNSEKGACSAELQCTGVVTRTVL
jgi:hypothetical protein